MNQPLAIALLAAGAGERFGGGKLDAEFLGQPLGRHALNTARCLGPVAIVIGDPAPGFALAAREAGEATLLVNPHAASGLASSVACAARWAEAQGAANLLVLLADMPLVTGASLTALVAACAPGLPAAMAHDDGRAGIPACFPRDSLAGLIELSGGRGAAAALNRPSACTRIAPAPGELADVDTPEALAELAARHRL